MIIDRMTFNLSSNENREWKSSANKCSAFSVTLPCQLYKQWAWSIGSAVTVVVDSFSMHQTHSVFDLKLLSLYDFDETWWWWWNQLTSWLSLWVGHGIWLKATYNAVASWCQTPRIWYHTPGKCGDTTPWSTQVLTRSWCPGLEQTE